MAKQKKTPNKNQKQSSYQGQNNYKTQENRKGNYKSTANNNHQGNNNSQRQSARTGVNNNQKSGANSTRQSNNLHYLFNVAYYDNITFEAGNDYDASKLVKRNEMIKEFSCQESQLMTPLPGTILEVPQLSAAVCKQSFELQTVYPGLLIGLGNAHGYGAKGECALGFTFDYVTGMPYIPASTVKGVLRSAFMHQDYIKELLQDILSDSDMSSDFTVAEYVENIKFGSFERSIFGERVKKDYYCAPGERDVFFDAVITKTANGKIMELENITPHHQDKDKELQKLTEPNPLSLLKVRPGVTFVFQFALQDYTAANQNRPKKKTADKKGQEEQNKTEQTDKAAVNISDESIVLVSAEQKAQLFKQIILDLGIGAKTNVGFGIMTE